MVQITQSLTLCPNSSITLNGKTYDQPGVFMDTLAGVAGCDTIITYHVQYAPYDVVFDIEEVFCEDGKQRLRYSLCNRGASDWPDEIEVAFYDADPTKGAANQLGVLSFSTAGADSCISGVLPDFQLASQLLSGSALYSVANFNGSLSAPFSFDDFPATMLDECDYTNNLDSFVIQLPGSEVSTRDESCKHPGQIIITANGGTPPFEYKLNDGPWGGTNIFGGLGAGEYSVSVRDASGCEGTGIYTIRPYIPLAIRLDSIGHIDCTQHEGFIAVSATGGAAPYLFQLLAGTPQPAGHFDDLLSGTYTVVVTDKDSCDGRLEGLLVSESLDSLIVFQTVDLCDGLFVILPNGDSTQRAGTYPIVLTRANGCDSTLLITVGISPNNFYVPNVFAPNKYGENEAFTIYTNPDCVQTIKLLQIYDRWGSLIFERANFPPNDLGQGWRGDHKGKSMPAGVYAYYVEFQLNNGAIVPHSGDVTIIR